ncbi:MAG: hypothetical protein IPM75_14955 [Candidatus Competibacteraceae bacterium]|nr:hypothetical protein [Candidatus Competibacteraceae bacterium]
MAQTIGKLGFKKVAILHDSTSYAKAWRTEANAPLMKRRNGGGVLRCADARRTRLHDHPEMAPRAPNPEVVLFTGYFPKAVLLLRQKKDMNWKVRSSAATPSNNAADLVKIAGGS